MPRDKKITDEEVGAAMKKADMSKPKAAEILGVTTNHLHRIIGKSEKLKALYCPQQQGDPIPDQVELLTRSDDRPLTETEIVAAIEPQGEYLKGLKKLGMNDNTISSIKAFEKFEKHTGLFMVEAMKGYLSLNIQQNMQLYEISQSLKDEIDTSDMDPEMKLQYIRSLTQISSEIRKGYDMSLTGINTMLKLTNEENSKSKKKAGFQPLKDLKKLKEQVDK
jgi:hypothetical protein